MDESGMGSTGVRRKGLAREGRGADTCGATEGV